MIAWLRQHLGRTICISLDHDLERPLDQPKASDPGTGREVADLIASFAACCPVVVHTTNVHAGIGMEMALEEAGWSVSRMVPYGDLDWIPEAWLPMVQRAIQTKTCD